MDSGVLAEAVRLTQARRPFTLAIVGSYTLQDTWTHWPEAIAGPMPEALW